MDVTSALAGEHGVFHLLVEQLDDAAGSCETVADRALTATAREALGTTWARSRGVVLPGTAPPASD